MSPAADQVQESSAARQIPAAAKEGADVAPPAATQQLTDAIYRVLENMQSWWQELLPLLDAPAARQALAMLLPDAGAAPDVPTLLRQQHQLTRTLTDMAGDLLLAWRVIEAEEGAAPLLARDAASLLPPAAAWRQWARAAAGEDVATEVGRLLARLPVEQAARLRLAAGRWQSLLVPSAMAELSPAAAGAARRECLAMLRLAALAPWLALPAPAARAAGRYWQQIAAALRDWPAGQAGPPAGQIMLLFYPAAAEPRLVPVYLRVYADSRQSRRAGDAAELWLHLCVATENLGVVDVLFCQGGNRTAVTAYFRQADGVRLFEQYKNELTSLLARLPVTVTAVKAAVGRKAGMYDARG